MGHAKKMVYVWGFWVLWWLLSKIIEWVFFQQITVSMFKYLLKSLSSSCMMLSANWGLPGKNEKKKNFVKHGASFKLINIIYFVEDWTLKILEIQRKHVVHLG